MAGDHQGVSGDLILPVFLRAKPVRLRCVNVWAYIAPLTGTDLLIGYPLLHSLRLQVDTHSNRVSYHPLRHCRLLRPPSPLLETDGHSLQTSTPCSDPCTCHLAPTSPRYSLHHDWCPVAQHSATDNHSDAFLVALVSQDPSYPHATKDHSDRGWVPPSLPPNPTSSEVHGVPKRHLHRIFVGELYLMTPSCFHKIQERPVLDFTIDAFAAPHPGTPPTVLAP